MPAGSLRHQTTLQEARRHQRVRMVVRLPIRMFMLEGEVKSGSTQETETDPERCGKRDGCVDG